LEEEIRILKEARERGEKGIPIIIPVWPG